MSTRSAPWRRALARALFIATSFITTPAAACDLMPVQALADHLADAQRFAFGPGLLMPFMVLWYEHRRTDLPDVPDRAEVYARPGQPLLIAFEREGCLLAAIPVQPAELWRVLRAYVGPIA